MKLGPVTKIDKINKARSKNLTMTSLLFFQFMVNLEPFGSWIPDAWFVKLIFSIIGTFYLPKTENKTKKL